MDVSLNKAANESSNGDEFLLIHFYGRRQQGVKQNTKMYCLMHRSATRESKSDASVLQKQI